MTTLSADLSISVSREGLTRDVAQPAPVVVAPDVSRPRLVAEVLPASLALLGLGLLAFVAQVGVLSSVQHARSQTVAYADLRRDLSAATVPTGQLDLNGRLVTLGTPLGYLTAPSLGLDREVFFEGTTATVTEKGPGHRRSSVLPGQPGVSILYGRKSAYGGPFGKVADLSPGAVLTFTTGQGTSTYTVAGMRHAGGRIPSVPAGSGLLTLVTSEGPPFVAEDAVYVDALLTSPPKDVAPPVLTSGSLASSENPLSGDPSAWPMVFLALQGLALSGLVVAWASRRYGTHPSWIVGVPVLGLFLLLSSQQALRLMPNLL